MDYTSRDISSNVAVVIPQVIFYAIKFAVFFLILACHTVGQKWDILVETYLLGPWHR